MILQANGIQRKVPPYLHQKNIFYDKKGNKRKEGHLTMIMRTIHLEDIIVINIYATNLGAPKYLKQLLIDLKGETDKNTITVGDLNTPLTAMNRLFIQEVNKDI